MKIIITESQLQTLLKESYMRLSDDDNDNLLGYLYEMGFDNDDALYELNNLTDHYDMIPDSVTLYRIVFADSKEEIDKQYPGSHYSLKKKDLLDSHYGPLRDSSYGEKCFMIKVKAQKHMIDFYESIKNNILYPNEKEITLLNKGFGVDVIEITQIN
jgi:hypothetical protein